MKSYFFLLILLLSFFYLSNQHLSSNNSNLRKTINNPCYLKGYSNVMKNVIGIGNYTQCLNIMRKIANKQRKDKLILFHNNEVIINGKEFKDVIDYLQSTNTNSNITVLEYKSIIEELFTYNFDEFTSSFSSSSKYDTISSKLVFLLALIDKESVTNNIKDNSNIRINCIQSKQLLLKIQFLNSIPVYLIISFILLLCIYFILFILLRKKTLKYITSKLPKSIELNKINDDIILSQPVKYSFLSYISNNKKEEIGSNTFDITTYKSLIQREIKNKNESVIHSIEDTIKHIHLLKSKILLSFLSLINLLSIVIISYFLFAKIGRLIETKSPMTFYVIESFIILLFSSYETLLMISSIDKVKTFYSNHLQSDLRNRINIYNSI